MLYIISKGIKMTIITKSYHKIMYRGEKSITQTESLESGCLDSNPTSIVS